MNCPRQHGHVDGHRDQHCDEHRQPMLRSRRGEHHVDDARAWVLARRLGLRQRLIHRFPSSGGSAPKAILAIPAVLIRSKVWMIRRWGTAPSALITARTSGSCPTALPATSSRASSVVAGSPLTRIGPLAGTMTENTTWISSLWLARGKSKGTAGVTMIFAVTMKMMSRTRVMSTIGVTLMPAMIPFAL